MKKKQSTKNNQEVANIEAVNENNQFFSISNAVEEDYEEVLDDDEYGEEEDWDLLYEEDESFSPTEKCVTLAASKLDMMFKIAAFSDDKLEIKQLRADIWEFQMYVEDHDYKMTNIDYIQMAHDVLSINLEQYELHGYQIVLAKEILSYAV